MRKKIIKKIMSKILFILFVIVIFFVFVPKFSFSQSLDYVCCYNEEEGVRGNRVCQDFSAFIGCQYPWSQVAPGIRGKCKDLGRVNNPGYLTYCPPYKEVPIIPQPKKEEVPAEKSTPLKSPELQVNIPGFQGFTTEESKIKKCAECIDPDILPEDCPPENCARWVYEILWIGEYILAIYKWFVGLIAFLAVIMIMFNGVRWLIAHGDPSKIDEAKKGITSAVIGLILVLLIHQILSLIDPRLTVFKPITIGMIKKIEVDYEPPPAKPAEFVEEELWKFASQAIRNQIQDASDTLVNFMNCTGSKIKEKAEGRRGVITSISDSTGISNCLLATYKRPPCAHSKNSCHYGGLNCPGKSYALDIWAKGEISPETIIEAIKECQSGAFICFTPKTPSCLGHYSHIHVSIGKINGCGCN